MNAVEIKDLRYSYKSDWALHSKPALHGISLEVREGEAFGFLGPNGAGKTTTMKCLLGLIKPTAGEVNIFGINSQNPHAREKLGYVPEQPYFYDYLTVSEIMEMYAELAGLRPAEAKSASHEALERLGIADRAASRMRTLSKGLTQKVALAQAAVAKPRILLLDEPFSGLDPLGRKDVRDFIFELKRAGTTILLSSHILSDVEMLCDRVSIMQKGKILGVYTLGEIPRSSGATYEIVISGSGQSYESLRSRAIKSVLQGDHIRISFENRDEALHALREVLDSGLTLESYQFVHGSLEELFVKLVSGERA